MIWPNKARCLCAVLACFCVGGAGSARVLAIFTFNGHSHWIMFAPLLEELAARGHDVVVYGHHPLNPPRPNYTDVSIKEVFPPAVNSRSVDELINNFGLFALQQWLAEATMGFCEKVFAHPAVQRLLHSTDEAFDAVIAEHAAGDCTYGFAYKFQAPMIAMATTEPHAWSVDRVATPDNPSYIPNHYMALPDRMNIWERFKNTLFNIYSRVSFHFRANVPTDAFLRRHFGEDVPPLDALLRNTSLMFFNSHFSFHVPRPTVPQYVEVGGLHIRPQKKLPQKLQAFLDGAKEGAVFFTLGSLVRTETMAPEKLKAFVNVFKSLPQRVLWKCNASAVPDLPSNVLTDTWMPQFDILSHPNVRVFITHGGLMGTQEAAWAGVPTLAIPLYADQFANGRIMERRGAGRVLQYSDVDEKRLRETLTDLLTDTRYNERAKELSRLFRDRPQTPLETAVFWTEYVIRHRGAPHMRSAAVDLPWFQYLLLDVFAAVAFVVVVVLAALWLAARALFRLCCRDLQTMMVPSKKEKGH